MQPPPAPPANMGIEEGGNRQVITVVFVSFLASALKHRVRFIMLKISTVPQHSVFY
jgi:hypothetical protein